MSSRDKLLAAVKRNQPESLPLAEHHFPAIEEDKFSRFQAVLEAIGAKVYGIQEAEAIAPYIGKLFPEAKRVISSVAAIDSYFIQDPDSIVHHSLDDVEVAVIQSQLGVAENGAIWITEEEMKIRVLPFICEHLVAIIEVDAIVSTMHEAYQKIGGASYDFGVFIAGPSKTADIEQSLVLGAHGPKSMTVLCRMARV